MQLSWKQGLARLIYLQNRINMNSECQVILYYDRSKAQHMQNENKEIKQKNKTRKGPRGKR